MCAKVIWKVYFTCGEEEIWLFEKRVSVTEFELGSISMVCQNVYPLPIPKGFPILVQNF